MKKSLSIPENSWSNISLLADAIWIGELLRRGSPQTLEPCPMNPRLGNDYWSITPTLLHTRTRRRASWRSSLGSLGRGVQ